MDYARFGAPRSGSGVFCRGPGGAPPRRRYARPRLRPASSAPSPTRTRFVLARPPASSVLPLAPAPSLQLPASVLLPQASASSLLPTCSCLAASASNLASALAYVHTRLFRLPSKRVADAHFRVTSYPLFGYRVPTSKANQRFRPRVIPFLHRLQPFAPSASHQSGQYVPTFGAHATLFSGIEYHFQSEPTFPPTSHPVSPPTPTVCAIRLPPKWVASARFRVTCYPLFGYRVPTSKANRRFRPRVIPFLHRIQPFAPSVCRQSG